MGLLDEVTGGGKGEGITKAISRGPGQVFSEIGEANPFRKAKKDGEAAAEEQAAITAAALEEAKKLKTTTCDQTTSSVLADASAKSSSKTTFDKAGKTEKELQNASIDSYKKQQKLVADAEAQIKNNQKLETSAQGTVGSVLAGDAFNTTDSETARINSMRDANIAAGANPVNKMLDERLASITADAARRGIRGQAVSQLQTGALAAGAESLDRNTLEANRIAAEQAIALPGQRVGVQAQTAGQFATFADQARQEAIKNRADLQDPVALAALRDERLRGGTTTSDSSQTSSTTTNSKTNTEGVGQGAAAILQQQAANPGAKASGNAATNAMIGAVVPIAAAAAGGYAGRAAPAAAPAATTGLSLAGDPTARLADPAAPASGAANQRLAQAGIGAPALPATRPQSTTRQPLKKITR